MTVHSQWCIIVDHAGKEQTVKKKTKTDMGPYPFLLYKEK